MALPAFTWYSSTWVRASLSASRASRVPSGSLAKASSVGAKTVKGPSEFRVSLRPAASMAAVRVVKPASPARS